MELSNFHKIKKCIVKLLAYCAFIFLGFILNLFDGYGWRAFLVRLSVVAISFTLNPYSYAVSQFTTGAMKLFLFTCVILAYSIYKLFFDYTKRGVELERKRQSKSESSSE